MSKVKTFFSLVGLAILGFLALFFRRNERQAETSQAEVERDQAEIKLKQLEAKNELDKKFEGRSDADVVLDAIDEQLRRTDSSSGSKTDKGSR